MNAQEKKENRLRLLEDDIGRALRESEANGELKSAPSYGKPMSFGDGYDETPDELKMPFKMLKDSGYAPPEVQLMRDIAALQAELEGQGDAETVRARQQRLSEMRQQLALRMEKLRISGSL
jgi:hypothetical protein